MKQMIRIRCTSTGSSEHGDWARGTEWMNLDYILCKQETAKWWDVTDAEVIDVKISNHPTPSSYLCELITHRTEWGSEEQMRIKNEDNGRWKRYEIYSDLIDTVKKLWAGEKKSTKQFYLGVDIVQ